MTNASPPPVVVAGEALIDLAPRPDGALSPLIGGGPFNTALALARLERPTTFIGGVSNDRFGRDIAAALAAEGVALDDRLRTDRPTSLAVAELDENGAASYRFHLADTSLVQLTPERATEVLPETISALHVGSLALALPSTFPAIRALVSAVQRRAPVMVDPNVRPAVIGDLDDYRARLDAVIATADVLKVSDADLAILAPGVPPTEAARRYLGRGPRLVLLTLGPKGAVAIGSFGGIEVAAPVVSVVDTIGAGDIFSAAWLDAWLGSGAPFDQGSVVRSATEFACRVAALSCSRPGAWSPRKTDIAFEIR